MIAADETLRRFVADALTEYGYKTTSAAAGAIGLVAAVQRRPP